MKTFLVILLSALAVCQLLSISESKDSLPLAFENVTSHLFRLETQMFIKNYGVDSETMTWLMLGKLNEKGMPFRLQNLEINNKSIEHNSSALITFDSFEDLRDFNQKLILTNDYYRPLQLFVYCEGASIKDLESLPQDVSKNSEFFWGFENPNIDLGEYSEENVFRNLVITRTDLMNIIQYEYFLIDEDKFVKLLTFLWYSPGHCGKLNLVEFNKFNKQTKKWENDKFVYEKLRNFHNCEIKFFDASLAESNFPTTIIKLSSGHLNYQFKFWDNFTILFEEMEAADLLVVLEGIALRACHNPFDRTFPFVGRKRTPNFLTFPVEYKVDRMAVPPGAKYSEYEKLVMPFDLFTWALIASTFLASFATIVILYFVQRSTRDFVIGPNVRTPTLNVIQIFFGISQVVVPHRNFARYLTMLFIMFCLIIRTAWQGKMYEFMTKDVFKPELQTLEEMFEHDCRFYTESSYGLKHPESPIMKRHSTSRTRLSMLSEDTAITKLIEDIFDPTFKGVIVSDIRYEYLFASETDKPFQERLRKEIINVEMCAMMFPRHHHFVGIFDEITLRLFESGIATYEIYSVSQFIKEFEKYAELSSKVSIIQSRMAKREEDEGPAKLDMFKLEPGFVIWLASLTFTFVAFTLEWLNTLKDYIVFKYIFGALFQMQKCSQWPIKTSEKSTNEREMEMRDENFERIRIQIEKKFCNREELI